MWAVRPAGSTSLARDIVCPRSPDLGPLGPIWVTAGWLGLRRVASGWTEKKLEMGMVATAPCLLQRGGMSFTGPFRARPGRLAWSAPAVAPGLLLPLAVEVVPSHLAAVLPFHVFGCFYSVRLVSLRLSW